ncbi:TPA: restriction endonuclease [Aeromonas hydrophila subsp. hydrophila]|nr:restriction endonuclease [Aeromonas hydrophila subsp. hydrophila]
MIVLPSLPSFTEPLSSLLLHLQAWPILVLLVLLVMLAFVNPTRRPRCKKGRHEVRIEQSGSVLAKIRGLSTWQAQIAYLRKIDPYTFEELILSALELKGMMIIRNKSYSRDGGVDGKAVISGELVLIQAKRYQKFISTDHVRAFAEQCRQQECKGLFIHTGRTPKSAWHAVKGSPVTIISGPQLIEFLT